MGSIYDYMEGFLEAQRAEGLLRSIRVCTHRGDGLWAEVEGRQVRLFCTNDYLGFAQRTELKEAFVEGVRRYGVGSTASRLIAGTHPAHTGLEERLRGFEQAEAVLLFNSGWHMNTSLLPAIADRDTELFCDRLVHASIIDGALLSRAALRRYPHMDMDSLELMLRRSRAKRRFIVTEGVFSMDGHIAHVKELLYLAERYRAPLVLDDAHGFGVMGIDGRGTHSHRGVADSEWLIYAATLGKAAGSFGAFVAARGEVIDYLINRARGFIYSTALPPALCHATIKAVDMVERAGRERQRLFENLRLLKEGLRRIGFDVDHNTQAPIVPVVVGQNHRVVELSQRLLERGFFVQPIRHPTVPAGTARLRITLSAAHSRADIEAFLDALEGLKASLSL